MWAGSFDSQPASLLHLQRDVSRQIAEKVRLTLSPNATAAAPHRHSHDAAAYDLYLQGRHAWHQLSGPTNRRALACYARATALDPDYALAWSGMSDAYSASVINADAEPLDVWPRARDTAARAVAADANLAECQTSLGLVEFWFNWNWTRAELAHRAAIALDPSYGFAYLQLGIVLAYRALSFHRTLTTGVVRRSSLEVRQWLAASAFTARRGSPKARRTTAGQRPKRR